MALPRPFGVGPYGTGLYSRYAGTIHDLAGVSGLTWANRALGLTRLINPQAISEIRWSVAAQLDLSWVGWRPCVPGSWAAAEPCEDGAWQMPGPCTPGAWQPVRLPERAL